MASRDVSSFTGTGRLVRDPELVTSGDSPYLRFTMMVNTRNKDGELSYPADVVAYKSAEALNSMLAKGKKVVVLGDFYPKPIEYQEEVGAGIQLLAHTVNVCDPPPANSNGAHTDREATPARSGRSNGGGNGGGGYNGGARGYGNGNGSGSGNSQQRQNGARGGYGQRGRSGGGGGYR